MHGRQQHFPDLQLEHVPDDNVHGVAHALAVIYHRPLLVTFRGAEVKDHLVSERGSPVLDTLPTVARGAVLGAGLAQPQPDAQTPQLPPCRPHWPRGWEPTLPRGPCPTAWQLCGSGGPCLEKS